MRQRAASIAVALLGAALGAATLATTPAGAALADTSGAAAPRAIDPSSPVAPDGSTPLQWAVYRDDAAEVQRLLAAGADVRRANAYGVTPMELAGETGNTAVIRLLLAAGADVESPNAEGQTVLMSVARTGNVEAAKLLIGKGADVNAFERFGGQTALMWAAARHHPQMVKLLASKGANVNARATVRSFERHITVEQRYKNTHIGGLTPLLYAVRENCRACVEVLLRHGADIHLPDPDGIAPLTLAMMLGNWDIAKHLVQAGADVNQWDIYGQTPLHVAIENTYVTSRSGTLNQGTDRSPNTATGVELVNMLLDRGADPNWPMFFRAPRETGQVSASSRGTTPFHRAVASGDVDLVEHLLARGADATRYTASNETPIMITVANGRTEANIIEMLQVLQEAGTDINAVQKIMYYNRDRGGSALHFATERNHRKVMAELVRMGADVNIKDEDGLTALDYAMSRGWLPFLTTRPPPRNDIARLLRELGATVELSKVPDWPGEFPPIGPPRNHETEIWPL